MTTTRVALLVYRTRAVNVPLVPMTAGYPPPTNWTESVDAGVDAGGMTGSGLNGGGVDGVLARDTA